MDLLIKIWNMQMTYIAKNWILIIYDWTAFIYSFGNLWICLFHKKLELKEEKFNSIFFKTPNYLYRNTRMNMISCIIFSILHNIFAWQGYIMYFLTVIAYYITHIGRKKK